MKYLSQLTFSVLLFLGIHSLPAQDADLFIHYKNNFQAQYNLDSINKLTFTLSAMTLDYSNGSSEKMRLSDMRYLSFKRMYVGIPNVKIPDVQQLLFYPNPVQGQVRIDCESINSQVFELVIYQANGSLACRQSVSKRAGSPYISLDLSFLPGGIYICTIADKGKLYKATFVKY